MKNGHQTITVVYVHLARYEEGEGGQAHKKVSFVVAENALSPRRPKTLRLNIKEGSDPAYVIFFYN